jgi:hypothetical protein
MNRIIDFIKDFDASFFGENSLYIWLVFLFIILVNFAIKWLSKVLSPKIIKPLRIVFYLLFLSIITFLVLNTSLKGQYEGFFILFLIFIFPFLRTGISVIYKKYDEAVDRFLNR